MGKFRQILTELSARDTSGFSFPDNNFSKYQWIITKLAMCIAIVEICFVKANGKISSIVELSGLDIMAGYYRSTFLFTI